MPTSSRGERYRRMKKHASSSFATPSNPGIRSGLSGVERSQNPSRQKRGISRSFTYATSNTTRSIPRGRKELSREGKISSTNTPNIIAASDDEAAPPNYSSPMELNRMKRELEALKKQAASHNKTIEKQANTISSLKNELRSTLQAHNEQRSRIDMLEARTSHAEELTSNIEGTLQCQICIDTLTKPFALSPCGHVLCQGCLQDWFRNAPVPQDEMNVDEPLPLVLRKKTCPFCRATIRSRPLPLFILKSLLSVLAKGRSRGGNGSLRPSPPPDCVDPWAEIFPLRSDSESDVEDDDEEYSDGDNWAAFDVMYDDAEDDEGPQDYDDTSNDDYEGEWVAPSWEPPSNRAVTSLDQEPDTDVLLRRGATYGMIETYDMQYTHQEGLSAFVDDMCLYLGWNIELTDDDEDGERFIAWCLEDMEIRPYRWSFEDHGHARRLVRRDALEEYGSTDSENWLGIEDEEEHTSDD
ncbi:hypothetical protein F5148DRAFT_1147846 [Russula earlei]|uniref:Uncharacterized protein n=1 Tax=Russula earlei TaxID=71964 RepID=A0ACC0UFB7_9AGAM|nr:hypothetical protein F5148DRAFT_1147846 [Russula earlei]